MLFFVEGALPIWMKFAPRPVAFSWPRWLLVVGIAGLLLLVVAGILFYVWRGMQTEGQPLVFVGTGEPESSGMQEHVHRRDVLEKEKTRFFARVSHELRTPLTLLAGDLEDVIDERFGDVSLPVRRRLEHMQDHVDRLRHLTNQLLDLARLETMGLAITPERLDLVSVLRRITEQFAPAADRAGVHLDFETAHDRYGCRVDPEAFTTIVGNLIANALRETPAGGAVTVSMDVKSDSNIPEDPCVVVQVTDTGPGIPAEREDEIFEPFASFSSGTRPRTGTGIGLTLAQEFAQLHGGTIELESDPGVGSTFTTYLPLPTEEGSREGTMSDLPASTASGVFAGTEMDAQPQKNLAEVSESETEYDRPLLLIVDDNSDVRAYLRRHLSAIGSVIESDNGASALEVVRSTNPDLVLANVGIPELNGRELTRKLRGDDDLERRPILLLSGDAAPDDAVKGLEAGADDYIRKPFSIDELTARIEQALAAHRDYAQDDTDDEEFLIPDLDVRSVDEAFLDRVTDAIEANLERNTLTVEDLASNVGVSRRHLQRKIKRLTGHPAAEFVRRYRLKRAAELLASDAGTVSEIAYSVGFGTPKTFVKHFKTHFDCAPSTYAERHSD